MKRPIRLLALDLDGTVLNNAKHITPATRAALEAAIAAGVTVIPASGRPLTGLTREFLDIPGVEYALTSNGAAVYHIASGRSIYTAHLPVDTAADIMARLLKLELMATFFAAGKGYATQAQLDLLPRLTVSEPVREYLRTSRIVLDDPVGFIRTHGQVEKFTLNFLHAPDASKGAALLSLADYLGIPREQTMACGDSENDLEMLRCAGFSVGMANSEACVLPHVDAVTASNEEDGVARAIYEYIL